MLKLGFVKQQGDDVLIDSIFYLLDQEFCCDIFEYKVLKFNDGEMDLVCQSIKFDYLIILQSLELPFSNLELLLLKIQKGLSLSKKIILIITYLPYLRQNLEVTLGDKIIEILLSFKEIVKIIIFDPHSINIKSRRIKLISTYDIFYNEIKDLLAKKTIIDPLIILPDKSCLIRNKKILDKLKIKFIVADKIRSLNGKISKLEFVDSFLIKENVIIIDDMIDTGRTIIKTVEAYLNNENIKGFIPKFYIFCTHGVFSNLDSKILDNKFIKNIYLAPTLRKLKNTKINYLDVSKVLSYFLTKILK